MFETIQTLFLMIGFAISFLIVVLSPFWLMEMSDTRDILFFIRHRLVRRRLKKEGYIELDDFFGSLCKTNAEDWKTASNGLIYHPIPSEKRIFFKLDNRYNDDTRISLCLYFKRTMLMSLLYASDEKKIKACYYDTPQFKPNNKSFLGFKANHLFQHLLPILEHAKAMKQAKHKKAKELSERKQAEKSEAFGKQVQEKAKNLRLLLQNLTKEETVSADNIQVRFSVFGNMPFATFYLDNEPYVHVTFNNGQCSIECSNADSPWFPVFEQQLTDIQEACLQHFRLTAVHEVPNNAFPSPLVSEWVRKIENLLEELKEEKEWLYEDEYYLASQVYPSDLSNIMQTYRQLKSPQDVEEHLVVSLQEIYVSVSQLIDKVELNKKQDLEKHRRIAVIRKN